MWSRITLLLALFHGTYSEPIYWDLFDYVHAGTIQGDRSYQIIDHENGNGPKELQNAGQFGWTLVQIGDLDGDGVIDMASSAIGESCWSFSIDNDDLDPVVPTNTSEACGDDYLTCSAGDYCDYQDVSFGACASCSSLANIASCETLGLNQLGVAECQCSCFNDCSAVGLGQLLPRCGAVYVLFMLENATVKSSVRITREINGGPQWLRSNDNFGHGLSSAGDVNGDGVVDLAVGAPGTYTGGSLYILFMQVNGSSNEFSLIRGEVNGNGPPVHHQGRFASSVNNIGDLDGDGMDELAVTNADHAAGDEKVWILYLFPNGTCRNYTELIVRDSAGVPTPRNLYSGFGISVVRIQDINGDNITDLAIGSRWYTDPRGVPRAGAVFLCMLNASGVMIDHKLITDVSPEDEKLVPMDEDDNCGASIASVRDINLDHMQPKYPLRPIVPPVPSYDDLVVGCPQSDRQGYSGRAMIWFMDKGGLRKSFATLPLYEDFTMYAPPLRAQENYGTSMSAINDADGNGIQDFMVGAPGGNGEFPGTGRLYVIFIHREKFVKTKFDFLKWWLIRTVPPGFLLCMICIGIVVFCMYFKRKPDEVELAIKKAGVEVGLQRKRVKKEKIKVQAIYTDDYE